MKVILTEQVKTLGNVGEIVNVSEGYARNFLIPGRKAILADESNTKQMADYNKMLAKKVEAQKTAAQEVAKKVEGLTLNLIKKVGGNGSLFGTVTTAELAKALNDKDIEIERRQIFIDGAIKNLGTYDVKAKLFKGVEASFQVKIEMSEEQALEFKKKQEAAAAKKAKAKTEAKTEETAEETATEETTEA
ncbi:MAG: 50S ribosomal protein L9 [Bacteriovoracaceae bacterium]|jgi:large subunit ribosomal protein L9|nr:50S ribosomal protein L9 [Bacteriovoracaceae bacterium]